jgi:ribosomal protein L4
MEAQQRTAEAERAARAAEDVISATVAALLTGEDLPLDDLGGTSSAAFAAAAEGVGQAATDAASASSAAAAMVLDDDGGGVAATGARSSSAAAGRGGGVLDGLTPAERVKVYTAEVEHLASLRSALAKRPAAGFADAARGAPSDALLRAKLPSAGELEGFFAAVGVDSRQSVSGGGLRCEDAARAAKRVKRDDAATAVVGAHAAEGTLPRWGEPVEGVAAARGDEGAVSPIFAAAAPLLPAAVPAAGEWGAVAVAGAGTSRGTAGALRTKLQLAPRASRRAARLG